MVPIPFPVELARVAMAIRGKVGSHLMKTAGQVVIVALAHCLLEV